MSKSNLPPFVPVNKGNPTAFTCLGNWYDLADPASVDSLVEMLIRVDSKRDHRTAYDELRQAINKTLSTGPLPSRAKELLS